MSQRWVAGAAVLWALAGAAYAQEGAGAPAEGRAAAQSAGKPAPTAAQVSQMCRIDLKGDKKDQWMRLPIAQASVTQHRLSLGG